MLSGSFLVEARCDVIMGDKVRQSINSRSQDNAGLVQAMDTGVGLRVSISLSLSLSVDLDHNFMALAYTVLASRSNIL